MQESDLELTLEEYLRKQADKQIQKINERTEELINKLRKEVDHRTHLKDVNNYSSTITDSSVTSTTTSNLCCCVQCSPIFSTIFKTTFCFLYFFTSVIITSFATQLITVVRVNTSSDAVPDIILDLLPKQRGYPIFMQFTEVLIILLLIILFLVIILNKKQNIKILQRFFLIMGFLYLLRALCLIATTLPNPNKNVNVICKLLQELPVAQRVMIALFSMFGVGTSGLMGQYSTCGDYVFSGHTVALTVTSFFIRQYSQVRRKRKQKPLKCLLQSILHFFTHVANYFGALCILLAAQHYTIDVILGFYLSSITFLFYHLLLEEVVTENKNQKKLLFEDKVVLKKKPKFYKILYFLLPFYTFVEHDAKSMDNVLLRPKSFVNNICNTVMDCWYRRRVNSPINSEDSEKEYLTNRYFKNSTYSTNEV
ncbi:hypothetical protein ABK040_013897 [Willaertia magna]